MEEDDDESRARRRNLTAFSSLRTMHASVEETAAGHLAADATEGGTHTTVATALYAQHSHVTKTSAFSRSGTSSSSQEEGETAHATVVSGQYLSATRVETARSMESLRPSKESSPARPASSCTAVRTHRGSFLTASERDVREVRGMPARRALSGEDVGPASASAEKRRGLFAGGERRALQQLSLPPPERRLTILSPHSPLAVNELQWPSPTGIRGRRKKGMVLPKLILPRSDSDGSEVFFERCI